MSPRRVVSIYPRPSPPQNTHRCLPVPRTVSSARGTGAAALPGPTGRSCLAAPARPGWSRRGAGDTVEEPDSRGWDAGNKERGETAAPGQHPARLGDVTHPCSPRGLARCQHSGLQTGASTALTAAPPKRAAGRDAGSPGDKQPARAAQDTQARWGPSAGTPPGFSSGCGGDGHGSPEGASPRCRAVCAQPGSPQRCPR